MKQEPIEPPDMDKDTWKIKFGDKKLGLEALDLVKGLLTVDEEKRLTIQEVLKHPFFADQCAG